MNFKKCFLVSIMTLSVMTTINYHASETNEVKEYAPLHPTSEEVASVAATDLVTIPDANLERALASSLGVPEGEITVEDMSRLTSGYFNYKFISDLTGLEYAVNLTTLDLSTNSVSDITPLSGLTNLTDLNLAMNNISDITPLLELTNLVELDLQQNTISDITPVSGLTNLTDLNLAMNNISDITPLSGLTNLTYLNLSYKIFYHGDIDDISALEDLTSLVELRLNNNNISDITPLSGLTNLSVLKLGMNSISDITPVSGLTNLTDLSFESNEISDITPVSGLTNLTDLSCGLNNISDITPVSGLANLINLSCESNNISDITPVSGLTNLETLFLAYNVISDITPLSGLTNLRSLDLNSNAITDISTLSELPSLNRNSLSLLEQKIVLDDINVTTNDEILYTVIDLDGNEHEVSLGIPAEGTNNLEGSWSIIYGGAFDEYNGTIYQTVDYETATLTVDSTVEIKEETIQTDNDLIELFNVTSNLDDSITVDQSSVDYTTPGEYEIIFSDEHGNSETGRLIITDLLPEISTTKTLAEIKLGEEIEDFNELYGLTATEIIDGDLTSQIIVDDSTINYDVTGTYTFTVSVEDEENNIDSVNLSLTISRDESTIIDPIIPNVDTNIKPTISGLKDAHTDEEKPLSDEELINLFEINVYDEEDGETVVKNISVDQSLVDYSTPGLYNIIFKVVDSDGNEVSIQSQLEIIDVLPVLEISSDSIILELNSNEDSLEEQIDKIASEIVHGDLTSQIIVDDSEVDYSKAGIYDVIISVKDEEGNVVKKTVKVSIEENTADIPSEITEKDIEDSINIELANDSEDSINIELVNDSEDSSEILEESAKDYIEMTLAETGAKNILLVIIISVLGLIAITLKHVLKSN